MLVKASRCGDLPRSSLARGDAGSCYGSDGAIAEKPGRSSQPDRPDSFVN
jgi:hypothetical protein